MLAKIPRAGSRSPLRSDEPPLPQVEAGATSGPAARPDNRPAPGARAAARARTALHPLREVLVQRITESTLLSTVVLSGLGLYGFVLRVFGQRRRAWTAFAQVHRTTRNPALQRIVEPFLIRNVSVSWSGSGSVERSAVERLLGDRMLVLKRQVSRNEKGVVIVKFGESIRDVAKGVDLPRLLNDYHLVLEPSWSGYCDADLMVYTKFEQPIFTMAAEADDYRFLQALESNLVPLNMGPCDWVDPALGEQYLGIPKRYDIIFNSNWRRFKRHFVLFSALSKIDAKLSVALVGGSLDGRTADDIRRLAMHYGVLDQLTFFEHIPYEEVMRINSESRLALLLSLKEGSNRALAESFFCGVPAILLEDHVGGIRKNVVPETGRLVGERDLPQAIVGMLADLDAYRPRAWAVENISCFASTKALNNAIREVALARGEDWTVDIAVKSNSPEMRLVGAEEREALQGEHARLDRYLL